MKLTDLDAEFVVHVDRGSAEPLTLETAQGVLFLCPACYAKKGGPVGVHSVLCWFRDRDVPPSLTPGPGRWMPSGTGIADLTLSPSVSIECWHGFVRNGLTSNA